MDTTGDEPRLGGVVQHVSVAGGSLVVETIGAGPPLILLHGWTLDRRMWMPQVTALARHYRLIAYDRRGFGQSSASPDLTREPDDLHAVATACGATRFALVGMSQGARVALGFAVRRPAQIAALVLQGSPFPAPQGETTNDNALPITEMRRLARAGQLDALRALWDAHPLMRLHHPAATPLRAAMLTDYTARDLTGPQTRLTIAPEALRRIAMPALIITGEAEPPARQSAAALLTQRLPAATRHTIAGAGHLANLDDPTAYNAALLEFLGRSGG